MVYAMRTRPSLRAHLIQATAEANRVPEWVATCKDRGRDPGPSRPAIGADSRPSRPRPGRPLFHAERRSLPRPRGVMLPRLPRPNESRAARLVRGPTLQAWPRAVGWGLEQAPVKGGVRPCVLNARRRVVRHRDFCKSVILSRWLSEPET